MDSLPLHPKLVHLPIALAVLMPLLSAGLLLAWWRAWLPRRGWLVVVALQAVLVVSGVAALRTGETDEERVEARVAETAIEAHEEAAQLFVMGGAAVLLVGLAAVFLRREGAARGLAAAATAGTLAVLFLGYRTGEAGGRLVYQHGAASAYAVAGAGGGDGGGASGSGEGADRRAAEHDDDGDDD